MEDRLIALEVRYAHLEREMDDLSHVVFEQQKLVDRLTREVTSLRQSLCGVKAGSGDEPPPHY
jgi:SlyX protein